jgi:sterol 3beta-glucosyltransferase
VHITLLTYGSRGDVEPFVALGVGLMRAGYEVRLAAPAVFSSLASSRDMAFVGLPGSPERLVQGLVDAGGKGWPGMVRAASRYAVPLATEVLEGARMACEDADGIVHSFLLTLAGHEIALERGIPDVSAQLFPVFSGTKAFPAVVFPDLPLGGAYRSITHGIVNQVFWQTSRLLYGWIRRSNPQLPALTGWPFRRDNDRSPPILYALSPRVVSPPQDWPDDRHVTGYWFLGEAPGWEPPEELMSFLKAGPPPVCIGLGSTVTRDQEGLSQIVVEALNRSGQRGVIAGTRLAVQKDPENIFQTDYVPYSWLFPRAGAVVHHGGAGTTAKALRAGIPNVVVPFTSDQPFWGRRVHDLGAGPQPTPASRLSVKNLAKAIVEATEDREMRRSAQQLGVRIRAEDGVGEAVRLLRRYLGQRRVERVHCGGRRRSAMQERA